MSLRLIAATGAVTAAALALPLTASARPDYQFDAGAAGPATAAPADAQPVALQADAPVVVQHDDTGAGTWTVIAVAGGTLLAGAAAGAAGSRMVARHQAVRP